MWVCVCVCVFASQTCGCRGWYCITESHDVQSPLCSHSSRIGSRLIASEQLFTVRVIYFDSIINQTAVMSQQQLLYTISRYLASLKGQEGANDESIDSITDLIDGTFQVDNNVENFEQFSLYPSSLLDIFAAGIEKLKLDTAKASLDSVKADSKFDNFVDVVSKKGYFDGTEPGSLEYLERQAKLVAKYKERTQKAEAAAEENERKAEEKKVQGNAAITAKEYETAVQLYTDAINFSPEGPNSHIYYSNRAAAYTYLGDHQHAVDDCEAAIALNPDYSKAFSRLGLSYFHLAKYEEAVAAYERLVELEPDNQPSREELRKARKKLEGQKGKVATTSSSSGGAASAPMGDDGMPGLAGLMNNPMMKQAMDRAGGPAGIANLMKDPNMMAMAQQMMQNPEMMKQAMSMMGGGGGAGMPDMSALAGMMGGLGGDAGAPSSSSSSSGGGRKGKQPFRGFDDV
jgi:small glutamine-rich tetratricopeptide repeat-containing protein alpha